MIDRRLALSGTLCIATSIAIALAVTVFGDPAFDADVGADAASLRSGWFGTLLGWLSDLGYTVPFAVFVAIVATTVALTGSRIGAARVVAAVIAGWGAFSLLKRVFLRARPEFADHLVGGYSIPSGHATMAFALATALLLVEPRLRTWWGFGILGAYAVLTAASRVVLGVHFLTDVVAGALLGAGCALLVCGVTAGWQRRSLEGPAG